MTQNKSLPKRSEIEKKYTWAIEDLYASDSEWRSEYDKIREFLPQAAEYKGRLSKSADILLGFLQLSDEINKLLERVYVYANQKYHEDTANAVYQDLSSRANTVSVQVNSALAFATPEILTIPEELVLQFREENEGLRVYDFYLQNILRLKPHILSSEIESLLADAGEVADAASKIFSMFNNADIRFPEIKDENGEMTRITHGRYVKFLESSDRR